MVGILKSRFFKLTHQSVVTHVPRIQVIQITRIHVAKDDLFLLHTLGETPCNVWSIFFSRGGCSCYSPVQAAVPWGVPLPSSGAAADVRQSGQVFPIPRRPYEEEKTAPATLHTGLRQHLEPLVAISDRAEGAENPALLLGG